MKTLVAVLMAGFFFLNLGCKKENTDRRVVEYSDTLRYNLTDTLQHHSYTEHWQGNYLCGGTYSVSNPTWDTSWTLPPETFHIEGCGDSFICFRTSTLNMYNDTNTYFEPFFDYPYRSWKISFYEPDSIGISFYTRVGVSGGSDSFYTGHKIP